MRTSLNIQHHSLLGVGQNILAPHLKEFVTFVEKDLRIGYKHNKHSIESLARSLKFDDKTEIKELTELAIVNVAREIAQGAGTTREKYERIVLLKVFYYNNIPLLPLSVI
jgi:hypothetical protein